jgi:DNA-directed RNA polymerase specialized sigma24 family protein
MHKDELPPDGEGDRELVLKAASGDEQAFEALIRRKREKVFWIAYRIIGDEEDARDIAQQTFIRLWKVLDRFKQEQSFDTWLYRITVNLAIDHYRSRGPARENVPLPEGGTRSPRRRRGARPREIPGRRWRDPSCARSSTSSRRGWARSSARSSS